MSRRVATLAALLLLLAAAGCQEPPPPPPPEPEPVRLENPELGILINDVTPFEIVESDEEAVELAYPGSGTLRIVIPGPEAGVNLVASVEEHKAAIKAREGGDYKGGQELVVPHLPSTVFYSRGRYQDESATAEETVVFLLHPLDSTRQLRLIYAYPAGEDSKERLQDQLFMVLGELEGLAEEGGEE